MQIMNVVCVSSGIAWNRFAVGSVWIIVRFGMGWFRFLFSASFGSVWDLGLGLGLVLGLWVRLGWLGISGNEFICGWEFVGGSPCTWQLQQHCLTHCIKLPDQCGMHPMILHLRNAFTMAELVGSAPGVFSVAAVGHAPNNASRLACLAPPQPNPPHPYSIFIYILLLFCNHCPTPPASLLFSNLCLWWHQANTFPVSIWDGATPLPTRKPTLLLYEGTTPMPPQLWEPKANT